jgi:hypothetical protein
MPPGRSGRPGRGRGAGERGAWSVERRSADFQSAVSQVFNLLASPSPHVLEYAEGSADYESALQQTESPMPLAIEGVKPLPKATWPLSGGG